jgi:ABC-type lipoprotein release transport system permease subunit
MMLSLKLALRNIPAHGQRNLIIGVVTAAVSAFLFLFLTFSDGEIENIRNGVGGFYSPPSDLVAYHPDFWFTQERGEPSAEKTIKPAGEIRAALESLPEVREAIPKYWGLYDDLWAAGHKYLGFSLIAQQGRDSFLHAKYRVTQGRDLSEADKNVVLLHASAQSSLPLKLGDVLTLVGKDYFGQVASTQVTLLGYFEPLLDNPNLTNAVLVDPQAFSTLAGYGPDEVNRMLIRLKPGVDPARGLAAVQAWSVRSGHPLEVRRSDEQGASDGFTMIYSMVRIIFVVMVLLTLIITGFGIMNVVAVNLYDRQKEIGTYFCLGSEKPFLMRLYTWEILFVNLGGAVAGLALGLAAREGINALGISSTDPGFQVVVGGSRFVLGLSPSSLFWILGGVTLITILTSLTTLGKALNVAPVVAVRETE